jgi:hypothetical protein
LLVVAAVCVIGGTIAAIMVPLITATVMAENIVTTSKKILL